MRPSSDSRQCLDNRRQGQPSSSLPAWKQDLAATLADMSMLTEALGPTQDFTLQDSPGNVAVTHILPRLPWEAGSLLCAMEETVLALLFIPDPGALSCTFDRPSTSSCCLFKGESQALALLTWPAWDGQGPLSCQP